jgi:beta-N-acetylhexosaminidase
MAKALTFSKKKIGQLFIAAVPLIKKEKELFKTIEQYISLGIGGFMVGTGGELDFLETAGVTDIKKTKKFISQLKKIDPTLFIAIDGEGGYKFNLFKSVTDLRQARVYGLRLEKAGRLKKFKKDLGSYVNLMKECGINMNFAPILGVAQSGYHGYLSEGGRSYSDLVDTVKMLSQMAIEKMQENNIIAVGKHFPGYGPLNENPHQRLKMRLLKKDNDIRLSAFAFAIRHGLQAIMKGHVLSKLDRRMPATLSPKVEKYLRAVLKFKGLSITDEIFMGAVNEYYKKSHGDKNGTKRIIAMAKVNDILLHSYPQQEKDGKAKIAFNRHDYFLKLHQTVYQAVIEGEIAETKINQSYARIIKYKKILGLC